MEKVGTRVRDAEPNLPLDFGTAHRARAEFVRRQTSTRLVIKAPEFVQSPQGYASHYLTPANPDVAAHDWWVFIHEIKGVSGRHRHQGGLVLFVLKGRGYTTMNGERYDWEQGDLVIMPLLPQGLDHQHFNLSDEPSQWLAFIHIPTWDEVGSEVRQTALSQDWVKINPDVTEWDGAKVATEQLDRLV